MLTAKQLRFSTLLLALAACTADPPEQRTTIAAAKIATMNTGAAYVQECRNAGVPVPETVLDLDRGWTLYGDLAETFVEPTMDADLWSIHDFGAYDDVTNPEGLCLALPRRGIGHEPDILGMICMGRETGNVCFFARPEDAKDTDFPSIGAIGIDKLIGGFDLVGNPEGICSDCHAGENPFVVHPFDPQFIAAEGVVGSFMPQVWPTPIIPDHPDWVPNPAPLDQLGPATGQRCDSCHTPANAGRFPLISDKYPGYCSIVLDNAVGDGAATPTMPPAGNIADYADHKGWLQAACNTSGDGGWVGPFHAPDDVPVLPPLVEPPYACSRFVTVRSARLGALLELSIGGVPTAAAVTRSPGQHVFELAAPLVTGQVIGVKQTVGGVSSITVLTFVRDHTDDYPMGLPAPEIVATPVYECAKSVGVQHVPGATVTVRKTRAAGGTHLQSKESGYRLTAMRLYADGPFVVGDRFEAQQTLCADTSDWSNREAAVDAPDTLPTMQMAPPIIGQELVTIESIVQGAHIKLQNVAPGAMTTYFDDASWPFRRVVDYDLGAPLVATDLLVGTQELCEETSEPLDLPPPVACSPQNVVVKIATPHHGDDTVLVTEGLIPGATVRIFDKTATEIGNGSGTIIQLTRDLVRGEMIAVKQEMPTCVLDLAFFVIVEDA